METNVNITSNLTQDDITKELFNNQHLSDVMFAVHDKIIYAHSFELMKQSRVFQRQLEPTLGENKLIPILKYKYNSFYEFMRFIYTDQCTLDNDVGIELLQLAVYYKVVRLENRVLDFISGNLNLSLFEFCVIENYPLAYWRTHETLSRTLNTRLNSDDFLALHPDAVEEILKFHSVAINVTEMHILEALARWIDTYCKKHEISLAEGRQRFDKLVRLIRFPTMRQNDIRDFNIKYPNLLTISDAQTIGSQMLGLSSEEIWNSTRRTDLMVKFKWLDFPNTEQFQTKFSVSCDTILNGIRFATESDNKAVNIEITSENNQSIGFKTWKFNTEPSTRWRSVIISFGEAVRLEPNYLYTITFDYLIKGRNIKILDRENSQKIQVNDLEKSVELTQEGSNMWEMVFSKPE